MLTQFSHKSNRCCCIFRTFGPVLSQFSRKMDHCCCNFRTWGGPVLLHFSHVRKLQQHWGDQSCCNFRTTWFARKLDLVPHVLQFSHVRKIQQHCKNCNNNGPFCAKTATTLVDQSCRSFRTCENCSNTGGPVLLQFSHSPGLRENCETLVDQSCCSFRTPGAGGTILDAFFTYPEAGGTILDALFTHPGGWGDHS